MSALRATALLLVLTLLAAAPAARAESADREVVSIGNDFRYSNYAAALTRAKDRINRGGLGEEDLVELHKIAGLSAHYLGRLPDAESHFTSLLRIEPDFALDPFVVPPPAVSFLEKIRKELGRELDVIRQKKRLEAEFKKREREAQERSRRESEEQRRRMEDLSRRITLRTVEKRSFVINFLPFGAGQFQQQRTGLGIFLAVSEGATAAVSVVAYIAWALLIQKVDRVIPGFQTWDGNTHFTEYGILRRDEAQFRIWRWTKYISSGLFYALYALGVADAVFHHEDEVVTTTVIDAPPTAPQPRPSPSKPPAAGAAVMPELILVPGGATAGLSIHF